MDKVAISIQLRELATGDNSRGKTARLRDVFDDVEFALKAGVSRKLVLETLATNGLEMTPKTFDTALSRIRTRNKKEPPLERSDRNQVPPAPTPLPALSEAPREAKVGSHDPADLNKIFSQRLDLAALARLANPTKKPNK